MKLSSESFYDRFSFLYPLVDVFLKPQKSVLAREINAMPAGSLLDIGVGNGSNLSIYTKHEMTGIDTSSSMLTIARKRKCEDARLFQMDGAALQFQDAQFDYVVLSHVIAVVADPDKVLEEAFRVLRPGGHLFILNHFTPDNWLKVLDHAAARVSAKIHVRSIFDIDEIESIKRFILIRKIPLGALAYFKLLIYQKP